MGAGQRDILIFGGHGPHRRQIDHLASFDDGASQGTREARPTAPVAVRALDLNKVGMIGECAGRTAMSCLSARLFLPDWRRIERVLGARSDEGGLELLKLSLGGESFLTSC